MADKEPSTENVEQKESDGIDITPEKDGGVLKIIKRQGSPEFGHPITGDKVFVHYVGTLTDGTKFDSSRDRGEYFQFIIGKGEVIKAWDIGVSTMYRGELAVLTCTSQYGYGDTGAGDAIPPGATLIFEVELFDWKGEDLSPDKDEGITRSTIDKGQGYSSPDDGATCEAHIIGRYNGKEFENRDVKFVLGEGSEHGVVDGVELAIKKFTQGETSVLQLQSKYAYGSAGNAEYGIPAGANLEYQVKLKSFEKAKQGWEMDTDEKIEQSNIMKQKGTDFFKLGKYKLALRYYNKIAEFLEKEENLEGVQMEKWKSLMMAGHLNCAMCSLKLDEDMEAIECCDKALKLDPNSEKGLFRRASAYMNLHDYPNAIEDFLEVLSIDPKNKAAKNQIAIANAKVQQIKDKEKKTYAGMFQRFADADAKREKDSIKVDEEEGGATLNGTASSENTGDSTEEPAPISSDSKQEPTPDTGDSTEEPTPLVVKETNDSAVEQDQTDQSPDTEVAA